MDGAKEADVIALFDRAMAPGAGKAPADLIVYNAGNNRRPISASSPPTASRSSGGSAASGGFLVGREAARRLVPLGRGTVVFTGASASLRGKPGFAISPPPRAGLRMIAQSMAREYGPARAPMSRTW